MKALKRLGGTQGKKQMKKKNVRKKTVARQDSMAKGKEKTNVEGNKVKKGNKKRPKREQFFFFIETYTDKKRQRTEDRGQKSKGACCFIKALEKVLPFFVLILGYMFFCVPHTR